MSKLLCAIADCSCQLEKFAELGEFVMSKDATEAVLREALAEYHVHVELAIELVAFEQDEDGVTAHVVVGHPDSDATSVEVIRAHWLIGADGGRSESLTSIFFSPRLIVYSYSYYR